MPTRRYLVNGHVQGVCFRASTQQQAKLLGITGYARNLVDGSVEILACGDESALAKLEGFLWRGPPHARVDQVLCADSAEPAPKGFNIRHA